MPNETMLEAPDAQPLPPVRRCAACGAAAMMPVQVWAHSGPFARPGQQTLDCRCQACGASITLRDPLVIQQERTTAKVLFWTILAPLILLPRASKGAKAWADHPVVPGAPVPELRFDRPQAQRRCGKCGAAAELVNLSRHTTNGIPAGTERTYQCTSCGAQFTTESASGVISNLIGAILFGFGGLLALTDTGNTATEKYFLLPLSLCAGAWFAWATVRAIITNRRNREL